MFESFKDKMVDGTNLFFSIELMVCRDTPIIFANSSCVRSNMVLSIFNLFFIFRIKDLRWVNDEVSLNIQNRILGLSRASIE